MKKNIWAGVACATLLLAGATGCSEETVLAGSDAGRISLGIDFDPSPVKGSRADRSRTTALEITQQDLTLTLTRQDGAIPPQTYTVSDFQSEQPTGAYTLEASYGSIDNEGWDMPYYYGAQDIQVKYNTDTPVSLPVRLANSIVNVTFTDGFMDYMSDYTVTVTSGSGKDFTWPDNADGSQLYVKPGSVMVSVEFTKPNGKKATAQVDPFNAEARHRYNVTISVDAGTETLQLSFDDTITENEVEIDISDANLSNLAPAPVILADGFELGTTLANVSGSAGASSLKATVAARGKIESVVLNTTSAYLASKGWPASIDLANPGSAQSLLDAYGVKTLGLTGNKDVFAVVDFTSLISHILYVEGADNASAFSLTVTDAQGKKTTTDLFTVNIEKLQLEILAGSEVISDGKATVLVKYNGGSAQGKIRLYARNDRGTVDELSITAVADGAQAGTYSLSVESKYITLDNSLTIYAVAGDEQSDDYLLRVPGLRIVEDETNAFATHAYVTVRFTNDEVAAEKANVKLEVSTDGGNSYSEVATSLESATFSSRAANRTAVYHITGLKESTSPVDYMFRAKVADEISGTATLTTEAATQLPDAGFDNWNSEKKGDYQYLWKVSDASVWATLNDLSVSTFGSGSSSGIHCGGAAYKATSGTIPANSRSTKTTDSGGAIGITKSGDGNTVGNATLHSDKQYSGANAALIRTVGWGSGNAASAISGQHFSTCQNTAPGELYLGSYQGGAVYGYGFTSRPKGLSFYYHYDVVSAGNGDFGTVDVKVMDNMGNTIAEASAQLTERSEYDIFNLEFDYSDITKKASQLSVVFKSSGNSDAMQHDTKYWRCPGKYNISGGEYVGSELYIDEVKLIY